MTFPVYTYLKSLKPPQSVEELPIEAILDDMVTHTKSLLAGVGINWTPHADDPLYKVHENFAYREFALRQRTNINRRASLLAYAEGDDLDHLIATLTLGTIRRVPNETDVEFKERTSLFFSGLSVGVQASIESNARQAVNALGENLGIKDVQVVASYSLTGEDIKVYAVKADTVDTSTAEKAILREYLNAPHRIHIGDKATVENVTKTNYTIAAEVMYSADDTELLDIQTRVRDSVYRAIDIFSQIGKKLSVEVLSSYLRVAGVLDYTMSAPSADIDAVVGNIPFCNKNITDVVLTFTAV